MLISFLTGFSYNFTSLQCIFRHKLWTRMLRTHVSVVLLWRRWCAFGLTSPQLKNKSYHKTLCFVLRGTLSSNGCGIFERNSNAHVKLFVCNNIGKGQANRWSPLWRLHTTSCAISLSTLLTIRFSVQAFDFDSNFSCVLFINKGAAPLAS